MRDGSRQRGCGGVQHVARARRSSDLFEVLDCSFKISHQHNSASTRGGTRFGAAQHVMGQHILFEGAKHVREIQHARECKTSTLELAVAPNVPEGLHHVVEGARAVTLGFSFEKHQHGRSPKPRPVPVDGGGGHGGKVGQRRTLINCPEERDRNCDAAASLG